jgi:putative phosphoesterase
MNGKLRPRSCENDVSYCRFGVERLAKLLGNLQNQISGVIEDKDVEYIHRMRVASRRIRAAMPLFKNCLPKKKYKEWLKEIKKVTRLLGNARDLDVQIVLIQQFKSKNKANAKNLVARLMLESHRITRAKLQPNIAQDLERLQNSGILRQMQECFRGTAEDLKNSPIILLPVLEKTYWNIAYRIDDLLAMERYVHQENEVVKHHEMRIRAKWLRYTMETYLQLYPSKLADEIENMKKYQDVLGEMHDCDVLTEYARDLVNKKKKDVFKGMTVTKAEIERSLSDFLDYLKKQRRTHYAKFVDLWESNKKDGFFETLRKTTRKGVPMVEHIISEMEKKPQAEIAVLADVHGNLHALEAVIENAEARGISSFLNAGDLIGYGPYSQEVIELLRSKNCVSVVGNFDLEVFQKPNGEKDEKKIAIEFTRKQVSKAYRSYLLSLPRFVRLEIAGKRFFMTHGSPDSIDEHLYADTSVPRLNEIAGEVKSDVIITGHSHEQYVRDLSGVFFLDPGSVGRPGDATPKASYAVIKLKPLAFDLVRIDYDVIGAAQACRKKGLPESFSQMLLRGLSLESIAIEDRQRKASETSDCLKVAGNCRKISNEYWPDTAHYEQVRKLSFKIYDELQELHKLHGTERCWLECAAILHDIGLSQGTKGHNKESMKLILNDTRLPFASEERRIIASIVRYHRKRLPDKKDYNLASLSSKTIQKITLLSGILRLADSLDYSHNSIVENLRLKIGPKRITIECTSHSNTELEQQAFMKKKNLIEIALGRSMALVWKRR